MHASRSHLGVGGVWNADNVMLMWCTTLQRTPTSKDLKSILKPSIERTPNLQATKRQVPAGFMDSTYLVAHVAIPTGFVVHTYTPISPKVKASFQSLIHSTFQNFTKMACVEQRYLPAAGYINPTKNKESSWPDSQMWGHWSKTVSPLAEKNYISQEK